MAKKQDEVKSAIKDLITSGKSDQPVKEEREYRSIGVGLTPEEQVKIEAIAAELGQNRHAVLKYAVLDFIKRWDAGERPETKTVTILKP